MAILTQAEYEELKRQEFLSQGLTASSARQKARNTARYIYQALDEVYNTETGRAQKPGEDPKQKEKLEIVLPQNITAKPKEQIAFDTDKYGELVVTGIGDEFKTGSRLSGITLKTNQGDFLFVEEGYVNRGYLDSSDTRYKNPLQYYSRAFTGDQRDKIFDSAVGVDISSIPDDYIGGYRGRETLYGITGGRAGDISDLPTKKGILIPSDVAQEANIKANSYRLSDTVGRITGIVDTSNNPYVDEEFVYAREGSETAPRGEVGLRYIDQNGQKRYTYSWSEGGGWLSEKLGEVVDFADDLIQNPLARLGVSIFYPAVGTVLNAYAKLDSGEELSGADIAGLVAAGTNLADVNISDAASKGLEVGAKLADGASIESIVVDEITSGALEDTEIGQSIKKSVEDTVGSDVVDFVQNNEATVKTVVDVSQGKDLSESIVDNFSDTIVDATGAETTNEIAAVKGALDTAVQLDQGADKDEAALAGVSKYVDEGGTVDLDIDADLSGDLDLAFGDTGIDLDPFDLAQKASEALAAGADVVSNAAAQFDDVVSENLPETDLPQEISEGLAQVEDNIVEIGSEIDDAISENIPETDLPQDISEDLAKVEDVIVEKAAELEDYVSENLPEFDMPEGPDLPEVDGPDISMPTLDLMQFAGLLSTTGGGQAPTEEEQPGSQYQTQFDFLAGLQPLGMLGNFQRRS